MRKKIDRYINDALQDFAEWYVASDWLGKERDCVNIFAQEYLAKGISETSAIKDMRQIRIEGNVPQPADRERPSAAKDLVIWKGPLDTTWDENWKPAHAPRAIIEWKNRKKGNLRENFDKYDEKWLKDFTTEYPGTFGFLVSTHATKKQRNCRWAMVRSGIVGKAKQVSVDFTET